MQDPRLTLNYRRRLWRANGATLAPRGRHEQRNVGTETMGFSAREFYQQRHWDPWMHWQAAYEIALQSTQPPYRLLQLPTIYFIDILPKVIIPTAPRTPADALWPVQTREMIEFFKRHNYVQSIFHLPQTKRP